MVVTVAQFEAYMATYGDSLASMYIKAAQQRVEDFLHYKLEEQTYSSAILGTDTNKVRLFARPINEVTSVKIDNVTQTLSDFTYDGKGYLTWTKGIFSSQSYIEVNYKAGWSVVDNDSTCPEEIKVCVMQIAGLMQTESGGNVGISSKSFGDSGSRNFLSTRKYDDQLKNISKFRFL